MKYLLAKRYQYGVRPATVASSASGELRAVDGRSKPEQRVQVRFLKKFAVPLVQSNAG